MVADLARDQCVKQFRDFSIHNICLKSGEFIGDTYHTGMIHAGNVQNTMALSIIHYSGGRDVNLDNSHLKPYASI